MDSKSIFPKKITFKNRSPSASHFNWQKQSETKLAKATFCFSSPENTLKHSSIKRYFMLLFYKIHLLKVLQFIRNKIDKSSVKTICKTL